MQAMVPRSRLLLGLSTRLGNNYGALANRGHIRRPEAFLDACMMIGHCCALLPRLQAFDARDDADADSPRWQTGTCAMGRLLSL